MSSAERIAVQITDSYSDATQFESVAALGCGEWEIETAALLIGDDDDCTVSEVCDAIVSICKGRSNE